MRATGQLHSVQDIVDTPFAVTGLDPATHVRQDARFLRPAEPHRLVGNPAKAQRLLGWTAQTSFDTLILEMTQAELETLAR